MATRPLFTILTAIQLFLFTISSSASPAKLVNITVDDSQPLISYLPPGYWKGADCVECSARPDPTKAYQGTWHDSSHIEGGNASTVPIAALNFTGSAIYAYAIISHSFASDLDGNADFEFLLDGEIVGHFQMAPTNENTYSYNVSVYANASIPHGPHSFEFHIGRSGGPWSLGMLDYIVYSTNASDVVTSAPASSTSTSPSVPTSSATTTDQSSPTRGHTSRTRTIAAAVTVCCVLFLTVVVGGGLLWLRRRRLRANAVMEAHITKFNLEHPPEGDPAPRLDKISLPAVLTTETLLDAVGNSAPAAPSPAVASEENPQIANPPPRRPSNGRKGERLRATSPVATSPSTVPGPSSPLIPSPQQPVQNDAAVGVEDEVDLPPPSYNAVFRDRLARRSRVEGHD